MKEKFSNYKKIVENSRTRYNSSRLRRTIETCETILISPILPFIYGLEKLADCLSYIDEKLAERGVRSIDEKIQGRTLRSLWSEVEQSKDIIKKVRLDLINDNDLNSYSEKSRENIPSDIEIANYVSNLGNSFRRRYTSKYLLSGGKLVDSAKTIGLFAGGTFMTCYALPGIGVKGSIFLALAAAFMSAFPVVSSVDISLGNKILKEVEKKAKELNIEELVKFDYSYQTEFY